MPLFVLFQSRLRLSISLPSSSGGQLKWWAAIVVESLSGGQSLGSPQSKDCQPGLGSSGSAICSHPPGSRRVRILWVVGSVQAICHAIGILEIGSLSVEFDSNPSSFFSLFSLGHVAKSITNRLFLHAFVSTLSFKLFVIIFYSLQVDSLRVMLLGMVQDPRVILVKLADRLHNMRTM